MSISCSVIEIQSIKVGDFLKKWPKMAKNVFFGKFHQGLVNCVCEKVTYAVFHAGSNGVIRFELWDVVIEILGPEAKSTNNCHYGNFHQDLVNLVCEKVTYAVFYAWSNGVIRFELGWMVNEILGPKTKSTNNCHFGSQFGKFSLWKGHICSFSCRIEWCYPFWATLSS